MTPKIGRFRVEKGRQVGQKSLKIFINGRFFCEIVYYFYLAYKDGFPIATL